MGEGGQNMRIETADSKLGKPGVARLAGAFGFLLVLSLVASLAISALVLPTQPHQFYGSVMVGSVSARKGTLVSARIGGVEYTSTTVDAQGRYGYDPLLKVPADDPGTPKKEGGVTGEMVSFYVGEALAVQYEFEIWGITELNLAVGPTVEELTVVAQPEAGGSVTGGGSYDYGSDAPITATPADGCWHFAGWSGEDVADPASASTTVYMDADKRVTAHFAWSCPQNFKAFLAVVSNASRVDAGWAASE